MTCRDCGFAWRSAAMAEGLRALGSCPRCGGRLEFAHAAARPAAPEPEAPRAQPAPHLVLGIPRR